MLELFHFEACPYCKKVREKFQELGVNYISVPSLPGTKNWDRLIELGGEEQVPFIHDPKTGMKMYESADIIAYLEKTYGKK